MKKKVLIVGAGLGGLATALRLSHQGYEVEIVEKHHQAGGRLNQMKKDGFTFDIGPSFFSMSYEFKELFDYCKVPNPIQFNELSPLYAVFFSHRTKPFYIHKDLKKLEKEFEGLERNFSKGIEKYLSEAGEMFHDSEYKIVKRNFDSKLSYFYALSKVPVKHGPKLFYSMWKELEKHFDSEEARVIFSLVAFFLGSTPFETPAVYSLLNYTELVHDGYWNVKGGMYKITEEIVNLLNKKYVPIHYNTEIKEVLFSDGKLNGMRDEKGKTHTADIYVVNADAAAFRGEYLLREKFIPSKLTKMEWTLAPFTIYLGVKGKVDKLHHHNYFLGNNFKEYSNSIFKTSIAPSKPYYYVNVSSKSNSECAPEGCENIFILCPVPDMRSKPDWSDADNLSETIIADLSERTGFDLKKQTVSKTVYTPVDWKNKFNLYQGSGLGLAHGMNQIGVFRPANKDEKFKNLYYVGASTIPGTGLPMVVISSRLTTERILKDHATAIR